MDVHNYIKVVSVNVLRLKTEINMCIPEEFDSWHELTGRKIKSVSYKDGVQWKLNIWYVKRLYSLTQNTPISLYWEEISYSQPCPFYCTILSTSFHSKVLRIEITESHLIELGV